MRAPAGAADIVGMRRRRPAPSRPVATLALIAGVVLLAASCYAPRGTLDSAVLVDTAPTGVRVQGWVDDQDAPGPSQVRIVLDGTASWTFTADRLRPDVASGVPGAKLVSGFDVTVPAAWGAHQVCVWAVNTGGTERDTFLGCRDLSVGRGDPSHYAFLSTNADGTPARWDRCRAIHYVTRTTGAYPGALADVQAGLDAVSAETGFSFVHDGEVSTVPTVGYGTRLGDGRYSPVLIGFANSWETDLLAGSSQGVLAAAGSRYVRASWGAPKVYVTGRVALGTDRLSRWGYGAGAGAATVQTVVRHEVGHIVGLAHVDDTAQIMNPAVGYHADWGAGDRSGLRAESTLSLCGGSAPVSPGGPTAPDAPLEDGPVVLG